MEYGVTKKQLKLFNFVKDYIKENTISPSYDEMMVGLDLNSKCGIATKIKQLQERGWVSVLPGRNRSINIIKT